MRQTMFNRDLHPFSRNEGFVSVTKLQTLADCPRKYALKYVHSLQEEKKFYLTRGNILHEVIAEYLRDPSKSEEHFLGMIAEKFVQAKDAGEPVCGDRHTEFSVLDSIVEGFKSFRTRAERINVIPLAYNDRGNIIPAVELPFRVPFVDLDTMEPIEGITVDIFGFIDLICRDDENGISVRDHKLHSKAYSNFAVATDLQLAIYAYVFKFLAKMGCFPDVRKVPETINVGFNSLLLKAGKGINFTFVNRVITDDNIRAATSFVRDILRVEQFMRDNNCFYPSFGDQCSWKCAFPDICVREREGRSLLDLVIAEKQSQNVAVPEEEDDEVF